MLATILSAFTRRGDPQEARRSRRCCSRSTGSARTSRSRASTSRPSTTVQEQFGGGGILGLLNMFSGGGLSRIAIFALGIMPYITASIILQLLTVVVPSLEKLSKEGEVGQARITQYTRYLTVGLAFAQAIGYVFLFRSFQASAGQPVIDNFNVGDALPDRHGADRRLRAADVDRRADHPARHRQRHLADDLRLDRRRACRTASRRGGRTPTRSSR